MDSLDSLRKNIEKIDIKVTELLLDRYKIVKEIGNLKRKKNLPVYQKNREELLLKSLKNHCNKRSMKFSYLFNIFKNIHKESRKIQRSRDR